MSMYSTIFNYPLLVLLYLTCFSGYSQLITVKSKTDQTALGYVHVQVRSLTKTEFTKDFSTNERGTLDLGAYLAEDLFPFQIRVMAMGYLSLSDTLHDRASLTFFLTLDPITMTPVVLTGQYKETSISEAVHKVSVIDRKTMDRMGAVNLRDVLNNSLNIRMSQDNILGSSMQMQGIGGENVKFMIDGVPVIGRHDGNIDLTQLNLNDVERIEIIEGPMAVNFGTDALAGVINIITKKDQKKSLELVSDTYYESNGTYNQSVREGVKEKRLFVSGTVARNFFDGWNPGDPDFQLPKRTLADHTRNKQWKPKEQWMTGVKVGYAIKESKINYAFDYFDELILNRGEPRGSYKETAFDDTYKTRRNNHSFTYFSPVGKNRSINLIVARNHYNRAKNTYLKELTALGQILTEDADDHDTTNIVSWLARGTFASFGDSAGVQFDAGYDINYERFKGQRIEGSEQALTDAAVFSSLQYKPIQTLTIRPGLRLGYNSAFKSPVIPSLNIHYRLSDIVLRASYARGFRAPGLKELYLDFVDINHNIKGNPKLDAEYSHNFQLGAQFRPGNRKVKNMGLDGSVFYNAISNLINLAVISGTEYTYFNIGTFRTHGLNLNGEWRHTNIAITAGGSLIGRLNKLSAGNTGLPQYTYAPEWRLSFVWSLRKIGDLSVFYKYNGKIPSYTADEDGSIRQTELADYSMADVSLTKQFVQKRIALTIGAKNLFNIQRINSTSVNSTAHSVASGSVPVGMGRTWFARLSVNVSKR